MRYGLFGQHTMLPNNALRVARTVLVATLALTACKLDEKDVRLEPPLVRATAAAYAGSMAQSIGHFGAHSNPSCVSSRPVSMRIERDDVTISYADWGGHKIDYHGKVDATGKINAWHTNSDGSSSILSGRIGGDGFTGHLLDAQNCAYALTMPTPAVATAPATR